MSCILFNEMPICCEKKSLFPNIIRMMNKLGIVISDQEKEHMKDSDYVEELWSDFIPKEHSDAWYNVRIGCQDMTMLGISDHEGFKNK